MAASFDTTSTWIAPESTRNVSWLGLVARTAFGGMEVAKLRVEVAARRLPRRGLDGLRLIVQSYAPEALGEDRRPRPHARPLASAQHTVRPAELEAGVVVDLLEFDATLDAVVIVAWLEEGDTQLEYDARAQRPAAECWYGVTPSQANGPNRVQLLAPR